MEFFFYIIPITYFSKKGLELEIYLCMKKYMTYCYIIYFIMCHYIFLNNVLCTYIFFC